MVLSSSVSTEPAGAGSENTAAAQQLSAEKKGAKRILHRLIARIESHDPSSSSSAAADDSRLFDLDQSLFHDPERSILAPSSTYLSTPNGKTKVGRSFEGDLVDDVISAANVFEEYARKASFAAEEQSVALAAVSSRNEKLIARAQALESELEQARSDSTASSEKDARMNQLQAELTASEQREGDLASQLQQSQSQVTELQGTLQNTQARLDQITAEQELIISAAAKKFKAQIEALEMQLEEQGNSTAVIPAPESDPSERTSELEAKLQSTSAELTRLQAERDAAGREAETRIAALEADLAQRQSKTSDLQSILTELQEKKERLHAIQLHNSQIRSLERVLAQQERIVNLLERPADGESGEWMAHAQELSASLALLKTQAAPIAVQERTETSTMTDAEEPKPESVDVAIMTDAAPENSAVESSNAPTESNDDLIAALKEQIEELEARVLRRNEQIGSLQRQLKNTENDLARTRTNQMLAEETVMDLDAEKTEQLAQIKLLEERIALIESSAPQQDHDQVDVAMQTAASETETGGVSELQASLSSAHERITSLTARIEELSGSNASMQAEEETLESTIATLNTQVASLQNELTAAIETAQLSESQHDQDLASLKSTLRKTEDRLASTQLELDTLHLTLAEQRESASGDAELISTLQTQLSTLQVEHTSLIASSGAGERALEETRASISDLTTRFAAVENEALSTRSELESKTLALDELVAKHTELEHVLAERDAAMTARNAEYWNLKEELAELQEEAERSRDVDPAALSELQAQLGEATRAKVELEDRVASQESALLRLKSDLTSARSTEEMLNEQYNASQRRAKDLETLVSQLESSLPSQPAEDAETKQKLAQIQEEIEDLRTRNAELEEELERKAEEIEEADSKILDAMKDSKKYSLRYNKMSAKFEGLQKEVGAAQEKVTLLEGELEKEREKVRAARREQSRKEVGGMVRSGSGESLAGRKRSKPDYDEDITGGQSTREEVAGETTTPARESAVKAVYAPSPSTHTATRTPSSFTPLRRSALKSASRSHTKPVPTSSQPIVLGHGTPSTLPTSTSTSSEGGMVRSTSNPSELIAARLSASPIKPLLSDKTNLSVAAGGTSRLSSKLGSHPEQPVLKSKVKSATSLLPAEKKGEERKALGASAGSAAAGGGAADFLAKMKAQRAQRA
uniref:Uncharacterized protein n=2 Tax=Kalmanozyma brasiliensis (strain GHG001) TaxID=1365824 RepID=V5EFR1_KALBG